MNNASARKIIQENMPAIRDICRKNYHRVKRFCSYDDLVQDVVTRILTSNFDNTQKVLAYVNSIVRNITTDIIRKNAKKMDIEKEKLANTSAKDDFSPDLFEETGVSRAKLYAAISRLTPRQQQVIFSMLEEKNAERIAKEIGIDKRMVFKHSFDAISRLRKEFIQGGLKVPPRKRRPKI